MRIDFDNTFVNLPGEFHAEAEPSAAIKPTLIAFNEPLAVELGIERGDATDQELAELWSGARLPEGAQPIATVYAGHQFGHPVPRLGDGRAILIGEVLGTDGVRRDLQLKGAGRTLYSRGGDGLSPLGPVLREYILSEAMHALGVPTTRALAAVSTGAPVLRREGPLPGAISTRVAASHLRIGTFEYFARQSHDELRVLLDYAIARHDADLEGDPDRAFRFFERVADRTLAMVASWWSFGFIHGVMNTDNTLVSGETIDYGPCAFIDTFRRDAVYSSIDHGGRYRFENQAPVAVWNLSVLASCLIPLVDEDEKRAVARLEEAIGKLQSRFQGYWLAAMAPKLGIAAPEPGDAKLIDDYLDLLQKDQRDFTNAFRALPGELDHEGPWHDRWRERLAREGRERVEVVAAMNAHNPYVIPRNHQVAKAIEDARDGDFSHFHALNEALAKPYETREASEKFTAPPKPDEVVHQTFCGT